MFYVIENVHSITRTNPAVDADGTFIVTLDWHAESEENVAGETHQNDSYALLPDDPYGLAPALRQWMVDHSGEYTILPYVPPADPGPQPYRIAKSTPWLRMTDEEAELITGAMQQAPSRQKGIYDAATYLSSDDPLWAALHDMIATTLNSSTRADELLAPET